MAFKYVAAHIANKYIEQSTFKVGRWYRVDQYDEGSIPSFAPIVFIIILIHIINLFYRACVLFLRMHGFYR